MLIKIRENLIDEAASALLLRNIFRYRNRPPAYLAPTDLTPACLSGRREDFFSTNRQLSSQDFQRGQQIVSEDLERREFSFESEVRTPFAESNRVQCTHWSKPGHKNQRIILGMDGIVQFRDTWFRTLAKHVLDAGWDVVMMDAPFNHRRTPAGYRPGQLILRGNFYHFLSIGRQSILDLKSLAEFYQRQGLELALVGVSLGGWAVTTVSQLLNHVQFLHAVTPPLEMSWMLREGGAIVRAAWPGLSQDSLDWGQMQFQMRPLSPYHYPLSAKPQHVCFHTARYDRFVSTERIMEYADRVGARIQEWPRGHIKATCRRDIAVEIGRQIRDRS